MLGFKYLDKIKKHLDRVMEEQWEHINHAAEKISQIIIDGGVLHLFGSGHSHLLVEEVFYRAGGLVPVNPIFDSAIMLHEGAVKSSKIEKIEGYAKFILDNYFVSSGEVIIVISNSGINAVPVEMALEAKRKGLFVIALTSRLAYSEYSSRHSSGKRLADNADLVIDTGIPYGDALLEIPDRSIKVAPGSTVIGATILNVLIAETVERIAETGITPPVFISANVEKQDHNNDEFIKKYRRRIKHL